jgi:excisionase family DNA binding protein
MATHYEPRLTTTLEPLLTVNDVAKVLRTSRGNVYRLITANELHPFRVGERFRFSATDVRAYLEQQQGGDASEIRDTRRRT